MIALVSAQTARSYPLGETLTDARHELTDDIASAAPGSPPVPRAASVSVARVRHESADVRLGHAYALSANELFSFAVHTTRDRDLAEDLVQEAFARLLHQMRDDRDPDDPRAWLYRVVANLAISRGRRTAVADRWNRFLAPREDVHPSPELTVLRRERHDDLTAALATLGPAARTALLLAAQGFSGHEVAVAIGRSDAATRTLMCRAREQLRSVLEGPAEG
jgi:RNA polymerase sigma-70 factor (ECF subfamily)